MIISIVTPATMVAQLEKGEVDIAAAGGIGDIPLDDWERVQALPNVTAASYQDNGYQYAVINMRPDSIWGDKRLRQALAYGINRQLIVDSLLKGEGVVAQGPIVPVTYYYNTEVEGLFSYDPEKAKELLVEAGWDPDYEMTIIVPIGNVVRELSADIIQANLAEIGIKAGIEKMDFPTLIQRAMDGDYDLALMGWGGLLDGRSFAVRRAVQRRHDQHFRNRMSFWKRAPATPKPARPSDRMVFSTDTRSSRLLATSWPPSTTASERSHHHHQRSSA